jgi:hypothetical protein
MSYWTKPRRGARSLTAWVSGLAIVASAAGLATPVAAGPPYVTDDPEPTDLGHLEVYAFVAGTHAAGDTSGQAGLDINVGAAKNLQLTLVLPADYDQGGASRWGMGAIELAAKYRFLHQAEGGWTPDVSLFPRVYLPTASDRFGDGRTPVFLPLWAEKDFGPWSTFGGGGYTINPGPGNKNYWLLGWAATRKITDRLQLGAEIYHQTPDAPGQRDQTGFGLGVTYQLVPHLALIASGGPALQNPLGHPQSAFYAAFYITY